MTGYRLLCIYEKNPISPNSVRIEVNYDTRGKTLAPFLRKVTIADMVHTIVPECRVLYQLMEQCGLSNQPFYLPSLVMYSSQVLEFINSYPYSYVQTNKGGSLKRGHLSLPLTGDSEISTGELIGGELYISDLNDRTHINCDVRFRYAGALREFWPIYTEMPYLTAENKLCKRDLYKEEKLLGVLSEVYNPSFGMITIKNDNLSQLQEFVRNGWKIFVRSTSETTSRVYAHQNSYGIVWLSTNEDNDKGDEEIVDIILNSYLHDRHFQQMGDKIIICNRGDIEKIDGKTIIANWQIHTHGRDIYENKDMTEHEKFEFIKHVQERLRIKLYPYQEKGVVWLEEQRRNIHGCMLADEMGLGKTLQIIAFLTTRPNDAQHLVVVPSSLVFNWKNEIQKFAPTLFKNVTVVSYDIVRLHIDEYTEKIYDTIVVDEVQMIKNSGTQRYAAITNLRGKHKIFLSGTPIENSVNELWAQFKILIPETDNINRHIRSFQIQTSQNEYIQLSAKLLKPFILRRTKEEVKLELPDKMEHIVYIDLSAEERQIYTQIHSIIRRALSTGITGRINSLVLEGLLRLRQACVSVNMLPLSLRRKSEVKSSKLELVRNYVMQTQSAHKKVLVFSQFVSALKELETLISDDNIKYATIYGETRNREVVIHQFKKNKELTALLMSLKAGGVGLNLTEADTVILLDEWWNPAVEDQAIARAHRIGQTRNVLVLRLVAKDTIEEKVLQLQEKKRSTVDIFNKMNESLTMTEFQELLG